MIANWHGFLFWGDRNIIELDSGNCITTSVNVLKTNEFGVPVWLIQ